MSRSRHDNAPKKPQRSLRTKTGLRAGQGMTTVNPPPLTLSYQETSVPADPWFT